MPLQTYTASYSLLQYHALLFLIFTGSVLPSTLLPKNLIHKVVQLHRLQVQTQCRSIFYTAIDRIPQEDDRNTSRVQTVGCMADITVLSRRF